MRLADNVDLKIQDYCVDGAYTTWDKYIPAHTRQTFEDYLLRGYPPGSFSNAVLTNNLYRATSCADHANRQVLQEICTWVLNVLPAGSFGNTMLVEAWLHDVDGRRSEFVEQVEKKIAWRKLNEI